MVGVLACDVAVAASVALVVAARTGRMDQRWRPTVVALSVAGAVSGMAFRFPMEEFVGCRWVGLPLLYSGPA